MGSYEEGELHPEAQLTGVFDDDGDSADVDAVLQEIQAAMEEEENRLARIRQADASDD